jgi:hypothetical protein
MRSRLLAVVLCLVPLVGACDHVGRDPEQSCQDTGGAWVAGACVTVTRPEDNGPPGCEQADACGGEP